MAVFQINNFVGRLTRRTTGTMNSGLVPWGKSHSIDSFGNSGSMSFNEIPTHIDSGHTTINDLIIDGVTNEEAGTLYLYAVDRSGTVYKINTTTDAIAVLVSGLTDPYFSVPITLKFGGGIRIFSNYGARKLMIAHDVGMFYMNLDGTGQTYIANNVALNFATANVTTGSSVITFTSAVPGGAGLALYTGMPVTWSGSIPLPSPFAVLTTYYVIVNTVTGAGAGGTFQLASSLANAIAGTAITVTGTVPATSNWVVSGVNWVPNIPHPISEEFFGGIFIGNGFSLFDFNISSLTVTAPNRLNPSVPTNFGINSIETDGEGRYLRLNVTQNITQDEETVDPTALAQPSISRAIYWNGIDTGYDSFDPFSQTNTTSMFSFLGVDISFGQDFYGTSMFQSFGGAVDNMAAIKSIRPPLEGAITSASNMMFFAAPYFVQNAWLAGVFCYGKLDDEDQGNYLGPMLGITPSDLNTICSAVGFLKIVQNRFRKSDGTWLTNSKAYISTYETGTAPHVNLYSFTLLPENGTPNNAVYETQREKLTLMQQIDRITIYLRPSITGVSFSLSLVDVDGTIPSGGVFTYTFAAGTDDTLLQGSLEKIVWENLQVKNFQSLGLRFNNLGTVQPNISQVYIETHDVDQAATST